VHQLEADTAHHGTGQCAARIWLRVTRTDKLHATPTQRLDGDWHIRLKT
jgi:hypothetical protein